MQIREYCSADCGQIAALFYNTVHTVNIGDYSEAQLGAWASPDKNAEWWEARLSSLYTLVAEMDGIIAGFGSMDDGGYFDLLYVSKDCQRMGVATLLANSLERYAARLGVQTVATDSSITAKPFFEQRGYKVVAERIVEKNGQQMANYRMQKSMPEALGRK